MTLAQVQLIESGAIRQRHYHAGGFIDNYFNAGRRAFQDVAALFTLLIQEMEMVTRNIHTFDVRRAPEANHRSFNVPELQNLLVFNGVGQQR